MTSVRVAALVFVLGALTPLQPARAAAQLTGESRGLFVDSSIKGCVSAAERDKLPIPADTMKGFCTCMANKQADMTTEDDLSHFASHHELSEDYQHRIAALAPDCKKELGLDK